MSSIYSQRSNTNFLFLYIIYIVYYIPCYSTGTFATGLSGGLTCEACAEGLASDVGANECLPCAAGQELYLAGGEGDRTVFFCSLYFVRYSFWSSVSNFPALLPPQQRVETAASDIIVLVRVLHVWSVLLGRYARRLAQRHQAAVPLDNTPKLEVSVGPVLICLMLCFFDKWCELFDCYLCNQLSTHNSLTRSLRGMRPWYVFRSRFVIVFAMPFRYEGRMGVFGINFVLPNR